MSNEESKVWSRPSFVGNAASGWRLGFTCAGPEEFAAFRRMARRVSPTLYRVQGAERPTPFVEDIAVPPAELANFLVRLQNVLKAHDVTASFFCACGPWATSRPPFSKPARSGLCAENACTSR